MVQSRDKRDFILLPIFWIESVVVEAEKVQQGVIVSKGGTISGVSDSSLQLLA